MPNLLRFVATFFRAIPFSAFSYLHRSLPTLFPYLSPLPFHPALSFAKEVNKKLSYREQNALRVTETHERNTDSDHILYLSVRQSRLDERIMFSTCPSVRLSVCSLPTCEHYNSKTNEQISMQIDISFPRGQGHERSTLGVSRSKVNVTGGRSYVWKLDRDIILDHSS